MTPPARRRIRRQYPDTAEVARRRVVSRMQDVVGPGLTVAVAESLLRIARAYDHVALREFDEHLRQRPDALTAPAAGCPWVLARVAHALTDAGYAVTLPRCVHCQQPKVDLRRLTLAGRSCDWCASRQVLRPRPRCGELGQPVARRDEGVICRRCYNADEGFVRACAGCGKVRPPTVATGDGGGLCWTCAPRPERVCSGCGVLGRVKANRPDGPVCVRCYDYPQRVCGRCGRLAAIMVRARGTEPDLCRRCRSEPRHVCGACTRTRPAVAFWPLGPVCRTCYHHARANPATCAGCGPVRVLVATHADDVEARRDGEGGRGPVLCGPCAGVDIDFACRGCGQASNFYADSLCAGCFLPRRVTDLLTGPDHTIPPALQPLAQILISARRPDSVLRWLDRYPATVLPKLAALEPPITHDTIDALSDAQRLGYLRQLLVQSGVLPARCEPLERITPWLEDLLKDQPQHRQLLIRPYASWAVLRAARRAALRGRYRPSRAERDRAKIRTALRLLEWLDTHQTPLEQLTQADLETWLHQHPTLAEPTNSFITWTARRRLTTELTVPRAPQPDASNFLDTSGPPRATAPLPSRRRTPLNVRVAAALVLLYGLPVTRIRALTLDQITHRRGSASLTTGRTPIPLPIWLTGLIDQLATQTPHAALSPDQHSARLLFPGRPPSRPVTASALTGRLNRHGLTATPAGNTALLALAADLPASVLADAIGIHRNTATRWARLSNSDWATYLAAPGRS